MSRPRLNTEQKRALVMEFLAVPRGERKNWLADQEVPARSVYLWRQQLVEGAMETGMIPRRGVLVSETENKEILRLHREIDRLRTQLEKAEKSAESQSRAIDVLGKAIEFLQDGTAVKNSDDPDGRP
jgi:hypothetical protein